MSAKLQRLSDQKHEMEELKSTHLHFQWFPSVWNQGCMLMMHFWAPKTHYLKPVRLVSRMRKSPEMNAINISFKGPLQFVNRGTGGSSKFNCGSRPKRRSRISNNPRESGQRPLKARRGQLVLNKIGCWSFSVTTKYKTGQIKQSESVLFS